MLLSFAQFEREIAGERIRDKIAASKRKGMSMRVQAFGNPFMSSRRSVEGSTARERATCALPSPSTIMRAIRRPALRRQSSENPN